MGSDLVRLGDRVINLSQITFIKNEGSEENPALAVHFVGGEVEKFQSGLPGGAALINWFKNTVEQWTSKEDKSVSYSNRVY